MVAHAFNTAPGRLRQVGLCETSLVYTVCFRLDMVMERDPVSLIASKQTNNNQPAKQPTTSPIPKDLKPSRKVERKLYFQNNLCGSCILL